MKRHLLVAALSAAFAAHAASAGQDPFTGGSAQAGAGKAAVCGACHGPDGNSANPEWPKLAGQHAAYTFAQLKAFKSGERKNPIMAGQAAMLADADMKDLAAHFATLTAQPGVASPKAVETAQKLYRAGDAARGLAACGACHGPKGLGNAAAAYPRVSGQHAAYIANQLRAYRGGERAAGANGQMMAAVAAKLSDAEIEALASYVNGLQ